MKFGSIVTSLLFLVSPVLGDECFNTTKALVEAQAQDVLDDNTDTYKEYQICDGLEIDIGFPNEIFSDFVLGDYPILLLRSNARIYCNGCVIKGGFTQIASAANLNLEAVGEPLLNMTNNNVTVDGITFSGELADPDTGAAGSYFSAPGNVTMRGCSWKDFTGRGLINVGTNGLTPELDPKVVVLSLTSSEFSGVTYYDYVFQCDDTQTLDVSDSTFSDIVFEDVGEANVTDFFFYECKKGSACAFTDNCVAGVSYDASFFGTIQGTAAPEIGDNSASDVGPVVEEDALCGGIAWYDEDSEGSCTEFELEDDICDSDEPATDPDDPSSDARNFQLSTSFGIAFLVSLAW